MHIIKHFVTITRHRFKVCKYCFMAGLYRQGLTHDLSKYSPSEFIAGARFYQGNMSPQVKERAIPRRGFTTRGATSTTSNIGAT